MKKNNLLNRFFLALVFLFLYAPIFVLIVFSFNSTKSRTVWGGFSLQWYVKLFQDDAILQALQTTLLVSVLAALISMVVGTAASIGFASLKRRWRNVCMSVNNVPLTNADIVTGVSLSLLFVLAIDTFNATLGQAAGITWTKGFGTMLIAHVTFDIPYVILSVMPRLRQLDPHIYEAAQDLGATGFTAFRKVILPDLMPGIINGTIIAFTMSIDDFVISYFTAGSKVSTLAMEIYAMARRQITPEINAISTLLFVSVLMLLAIVNLRQASQDRQAMKQKAALIPQK
ncbi:ABC transporter permease [Oscillibacter hominis]|uniref:ABC transporter permease n=1 Tax=Oscillibacter hominis TaxID=2763056 RepID=A0A7G9B7H5_9FIRM|nr:ABC transporter permease [Oscillibacter hominis]QNL45506.1 ABC transporter permease [Oscillibacter hominis]